MATKRDQGHEVGLKKVTRPVRAKKLELAATSVSQTRLIGKVPERKLSKSAVYGVGLPAPSKLKLSASKFAELVKAISS